MKTYETTYLFITIKEKEILIDAEIMFLIN